MAVSVCLLWFAPATFGQSPCSFTYAPAVNYTSAGNSFDVATADLNGDGKLDLAATVSNMVTVSVFLGVGDGTFGAKTDFTVGPSPTGVAIGDLNGDGKLDLAVSNGASNNISVLLGNGDGTFGMKADFAAGNSPASVVMGDFNGDNKPDLAAANQASDNVSVLLGNGNGTFAAAVNISVGNSPQRIGVGDLNGDNKLDLVVSNRDDDNVSVLLGNGNGTFQGPVNYSVGTDPFGVALGDFNGDQRLDAVVANSTSNTISFLRGNGDGTFQAAVPFAVGAGAMPRGVMTGDINGDGKLDVVTVDQIVGAGMVSFFVGNGDGTFQAPTTANIGSQPVYGAIGDFDGDKKPDIAAANVTSNNVSVLINTTAVTVTAACKNVTAAAGDSCTASVTAAMVDNGSSTTSACVPVTLSLAPAGPFSLGNTPVTLTATGQFGITGTCAATITVNDATPPVIACPAEITIDGGATATYAPTATDNCDPKPTLTADIPSGSTFAAGTTTVVTVTARDASGNSSTCTFNVTANVIPPPQQPQLCVLLTALFRFPICGIGCPLAIVATFVTLGGIKLVRRGRRR